MMIPPARRPRWRSGEASLVSSCTGARLSITARAGTLHPDAKDIADLVRVDVALARQFLDTAKGVADRLDAAEREALLEEVSKAPRDAYERNRKAIAIALALAHRAARRGAQPAQTGSRHASPTRSRALPSSSPGRSR